MSASKCRKYSAELKAEAVKLVVNQGLSSAQAARVLGIAESVLCRWVQLHQEAGEPGALSGVERDELKRLRRENSTLRKESEILQKATAFNALEPL
jgi:transposase